MILLTLSIAVSVLLALSKPPLMMALLIMTQTILIAVSIYFMLSTSWLAFILFMVLASAMMVTFVYVSSLASNDFVALPRAMTFSALFISLLYLAWVCSCLGPEQTQAKSYSNLSDTDLSPIVTYKLYAPYTSALTTFLILYLLVALIVVAKISIPLKGALRALKS